MKTTKSFIVILVSLLTAQAALAWYDPSTQRWLSRDPMDEPGFEALRTASATTQIETPAVMSPSRWLNRDPLGEEGFIVMNAAMSAGIGDTPFMANQLFNEEGNLYQLTSNNPINFTDYLGLFCVKISKNCQLCIGTSPPNSPPKQHPSSCPANSPPDPTPVKLPLPKQGFIWITCSGF
jgi:hypothetical protein